MHNACEALKMADLLPVQALNSAGDMNVHVH